MRGAIEEAALEHRCALGDRAAGQSRQATGKLPSVELIFKGIGSAVWDAIPNSGAFSDRHIDGFPGLETWRVIDFGGCSENSQK